MLDDAEIAGLVRREEDVADPSQPPRPEHLRAYRGTSLIRNRPQLAPWMLTCVPEPRPKTKFLLH